MKPENSVINLMANLEKNISSYLRKEVLVNKIDSHSNLKELQQLSLYDLTAIISVAGNINMLVSFSFEISLLSRIARFFICDGDEDEVLEDDDVFDMAGELSNIIVGLCITDINPDQNSSISFSPPLVINEAKTIQQRKNAVLYAIELETEYGRLNINCIGPGELFDTHMDYLEQK